MAKKIAVRSETELDDTQTRSLLKFVTDIVKDRLSLIEHFRSLDNYAAIYATQSEAFHEIAKYLAYHMPELAAPRLPEYKKKRAAKKRASKPNA